MGKWHSAGTWAALRSSSGRRSGRPSGEAPVRCRAAVFGRARRWSYLPRCRALNAPAKKTSASPPPGAMRTSSTRATTIQWSPAACWPTIWHSSVARASVRSGVPWGPGCQSRPAKRSAPAGVARIAKRSCCRPRTFTAKRPVLRMRCQVSELREGQNDTRGGSSETEVSELTISPAGWPSGAAVMKATPVANLPSASRNERASSAGAAGRGGWAGAAGAISVERGLFAEGDLGEVVVGAVGAERVHEAAGFDVAVGAGEGAAIQIAGAAGEGERAVHGAGGGFAHERLCGLGFGEQRGEPLGAAVGGRVRGAMLVDQPGGA